jgi:hypothetical protein
MATRLLYCRSQVHNMLRNVAHSLVAGGDSGVFTPMHMLVFRKL